MTEQNYRIIMPVFNPGEILRDYFGKLEEQNPGALGHLLLVDDGSTNGVPSQLKKEFPDLTIVEGDGTLWWGGGIRLGMERALRDGADVIMWLNHDCVPDAGAVEKLVERAWEPGTGGVSAWCYCREGREFGVNPGFKDFEEIDGDLLRGSELLEVDGTNGNCVALNAAAVRKVGLPRAGRHPHYGDGPYLWRLHRAGFRNFVLTGARAALDREFDRCISERDHSKVWQVPVHQKMKYYWFSNRSKFHWRHKYWDSVCFRGRWAGPLVYLVSQLKLLREVYRGHREGAETGREEVIPQLVEKYRHAFPPAELEESLRRLAARS